MKMEKISRTIGKNTVRLALVLVGASLLNNGAAAAGEKGDSPAVKHKTAMHHKKVVPHTKKRHEKRTHEEVHFTAPSGAMTMQASHYAARFHGRTMANGKPFDSSSTTMVAHRTLPLGTEILLTNPTNGKSVRAQVQDRGPFAAGRDIDVPEGIVLVLGLEEGRHGTATVLVNIIKKS